MTNLPWAHVLQGGCSCFFIFIPCCHLTYKRAKSQYASGVRYRSQYEIELQSLLIIIHNLGNVCGSGF